MQDDRPAHEADVIRGNLLQPRAVLLVMVDLGVEVTVARHTLPLGPRLQAIDVLNEGLLGYPGGGHTNPFNLFSSLVLASSSL